LERWKEYSRWVGSEKQEISYVLSHDLSGATFISNRLCARNQYSVLLWLRLYRGGSLGRVKGGQATLFMLKAASPFLHLNSLKPMHF
jgi:hypothetical protein